MTEQGPAPVQPFVRAWSSALAPASPGGRRAAPPQTAPAAPDGERAHMPSSAAVPSGPVLRAVPFAPPAPYDTASSATPRPGHSAGHGEEGPANTTGPQSEPAPEAAAALADTPTASAPAAPPEHAKFDGYLRGQSLQPQVPRRGLRALLWRASGGRISVGASARELAEHVHLDKIRTPLTGWHTITVASSKGGVGKTTTSALLGLTLAEHRGDRVVTLDANPDAGNLAQRLLGYRAPATVRQLLEQENLDQLASFTEVSRFVNTAGRLQVLASDLDPAMSEAFNADEYRRVLALLTRFFNIVITDSGTGLIHSAMTGALETTRSLIVTGKPTIDAAEGITTTLDWLIAHGFDELVRDAIVVLTCDRQAHSIDPAALREHFADRCRAVVEFPADPHLTEGGQINLEMLRPRTRQAGRELAALVAEAFTWDFPAPDGFTTGGR
ncbi:MAG: hypothetical protein EKK42_27215 [Pseudonocardiaceae bacterium]|nr:MAG: hypothetical protein EKK42_27215 [Pseudonocardiaceae bacterium]